MWLIEERIKQEPRGRGRRSFDLGGRMTGKGALDSLCICKSEKEKKEIKFWHFFDEFSEPTASASR